MFEVVDEQPAPAPGGELADKLKQADAGVVAGEPAQAPAAAPAGAPAGAPPDESQLWIDAAIRYGAIARAMVPDRAKPHWTDERLGEVGRELAACAKHYGWKFGGIVTHPLARLAAVSFPLAWPILEPYAMPYIAKALGLAAIKDAQDKAKSGAPAAPGAPAPAADSVGAPALEPVL